MVVVTHEVPAPWGPIHLAATERGIVALEVMTIRDAFLAGLMRRGYPDTRPLGETTDGEAARHARTATQTIRAMLRGETDAADRLRTMPVDVADRAPFDREVFEAVRWIPAGAVTSYGRLAQRVGRPGAARAVGGAVGRNPVGLLIPCHRVIAGDGTLGGYGAGWGGRDAHLDVKRRLLELEGVRLPARHLL
jgi:methylated-DNA-[protein]-cysteine S-methyltransferase